MDWSVLSWRDWSSKLQSCSDWSVVVFLLFCSVYCLFVSFVWGHVWVVCKVQVANWYPWVQTIYHDIIFILCTLSYAQQLMLICQILQIYWSCKIDIVMPWLLNSLNLFSYLQLNIFDVVCSVISASSRAGGQVLQNLHMLAAYSILNGLMPVLGLTAEESRAKESAVTKFRW